MESYLFVGGSVCESPEILLVHLDVILEDNWFVVMKCKMVHYFVICLWGCEFIVKGNPLVLEH